MRLQTLTVLSLYFISCACSESVYITSYGGFRYVKVRTSGRMTSANVKATCENAGYVTPCPSWSTCQHTSPDCTVASLIDCGKPMNDLAVPLCGAAPNACPQFYGVYIFMNNFNGGAACGAEPNVFCANGNNYYNKYALCAEAAEEYLVSIGSWAFYKTGVSGTMTAANIQAACAAGGSVAPCPGDTACGLPPSSCTATSLTTCGNPMLQLATEICGINSTSCSQLDGVYAITSDSSGKTCGVEAGNWCVDGSTRSNGFALCARVEEMYLASVGGWSFYKVRSAGPMSSANVKSTCEAAGYVTSCAGGPTCEYTSSSCTVTSLTDCANPMNEVSAALCRTTPELCSQLYGVYTFMHGWPGPLESAACGSENGRWCSVGTSYENRFAFCAKAVTSTHGFAVLRTKKLTFHGYVFLAVEARLPTDGLSRNENWCRDYQFLCETFGLKPTGCGEDFALTNPAYGRCQTEYSSSVYINNSLSCDPSAKIAEIANLAFSAGVSAQRCLGFNRCETSTCTRSIAGSVGALSFNYGAVSGDGLVYTVCTEPDVDECRSFNGGCDQICHNTVGSYHCSCREGYQLSGNTTCTDIDECSVNNGGCQQICVNTEGSYICSCQPGWEVFDVTHCIDTNECLINNGGCEQDCVKTPGSYHCTCREGFESVGTHNCSDMDECSFLKECHFCTNTVGSYSCSCRSGYTLFNGECRDSDLYPYGAAVGEESQQWDFTYCKKEELLLEGLRFFDRRCYHLYVCDNGIVSFDPIPRPTRPHLLTSSVWGGKAVIAPFLVQSKPYISGVPENKRTKIYIEMYEKGDSNSHSPDVLRRARNDGRSIRNFYLPDYEPAWVAVVTWVNISPSCSLYAHGVCPLPQTDLPVNSFQLVLTSDGTYSFALFIYPARKIEWISPDELLGPSAPLSFIAVAGYNAGDGVGTPDHSLDMDGSGTTMMRRVWLQNSGRWGFALQEQGSTNIPQPSVLHCSQWIRTQQEDDAYNVLQSKYERVKSYSACPCTAEQAFYDETFSYQVNSEEECALSLPFTSFVHHSTEYTIRRTCCYTPSHFYWRVWGSMGQTKVGGGRLLTGQLGGHLIVNDRIHDEEAHSMCCLETSGVRDGFYCRKFAEQRPLSMPSIGGNPCRNYPSQLVWVFGAWGDPHITTLDGARYAFNGLGEYVLLDVDGMYMLQGRTILAKGSSRATVFSAIAAGQTNHSAVQVNLVGEESLELFVNNSRVDLSVLSEVVVDNSAIVVKKEENAMLIAFYCGITVKVVAKKAMLLIEVSAPPEFKNKTRGLMGRWDDDTTNDYEFSNGTTLPADASERDLYHMGTSWQVTREEGPQKSIFHYLAGESPANFSSTSFLPAFTDQILSFLHPDLERQARAVCGNDTACLFDVAETGDIQVGEMENDARRRLDEKVSGRGNFPPVISAPEVVNVTPGQVARIQINATDPVGSEVTFALWSDVPAGISMSVNGNDAILTVNVTSDAPFSLKVIVTNYENSSALYWPVVAMCSCSTGGNCNSSNILDPTLVTDDNRFLMQPCICQDGFTGKQCESDLDACSANFEPCFPGADCTDLPPPAGLDGFRCSGCPTGYVMNGTTCQDIDECETTEGLVCHHHCINLVGNFSCGCEEGFHLADDGYFCKDTDECSVPNNCGQKCENTPGSYTCSCWEGFTLQSDGLRCEPEKPCNLNEDPGCDAETSFCIVSAGGDPTCVCNKGYRLLEDGVTCQDKDECATDEHHCDQICNNTAGAYSCSCYNGFQISDNPVHQCLDIDECYEGTYNCSMHELCVNEPGTYTCVCSTGLHQKGEICSFSTAASTVVTMPSTSDQANNENAVVIVVEMRLEELTEGQIEAVKVATAVSVRSWCMSHLPEYEICTSDQGRQERDSSVIRIQPEDVRFLASFPRSMSDNIIAIAEYVSLQNSKNAVLPGNLLFDAIQNSVIAIEEAMSGKRVVKVTMATSFNPTEEVPTTTKASALESPAMYVITGLVTCLVISVAIAFLYRRKRKSKISPLSEDTALTTGENLQLQPTKTTPSSSALTEISI